MGLEVALGVVSVPAIGYYPEEASQCGHRKAMWQRRVT